MNQEAFLMRRLRKVRAEFNLTALAYNLRRVLSIVTFPRLMAALQVWDALGILLWLVPIDAQLLVCARSMAGKSAFPHGL